MIALCVRCDGVTVNGVFCHEHLCPNSYKGTLRRCVWCGQLFEPERLDQDFCGEDCAEVYYN